MKTQIRFGWRALAVYLTAGLVLEALHAFKLGWYVDAGHETRRLMLTLAHAHGTLLALVNIAAGAMPGVVKNYQLNPRAANLLKAATLLLPIGFLLGGLGAQGGDPGIGILLVPVGALSLLAGVFRIARDLGD